MINQTHHLLQLVFHCHSIKKVNNNCWSSKEKQNQKQEEVDKHSSDVPVVRWDWQVLPEMTHLYFQLKQVKCNPVYSFTPIL
jgi:hypothetical protein